MVYTGREGSETDHEALIREVKEELVVDLRPDTIKHYGTFEAQANGKPNGTIVRMTCHEAEFDGELTPTSEMAEMTFVGYDWKAKSSSVDRLIFDDLRSRGCIDRAYYDTH